MTSTDLSGDAQRRMIDGRAAEPLRSRRNNWNNQVRRHALTTPDGPALKYAGKVTTWSELDARSHAFAAALHRRGVGFGDRVLLLMLNRSEYVEAIFGANILGAIAVPVNIRMAPAEIAFLVADSAFAYDNSGIHGPRVVARAVTGIQITEDWPSWCPDEMREIWPRTTQ